jgi:hypothetical protein
MSGRGIRRVARDVHSTSAPAPPDHNAPSVDGDEPGRLNQHKHYVERYQLWSVSFPALSHPFLTFAIGTRRSGTGRRSIPTVHPQKSRSFRVATSLSMCGTRRQAVSRLRLRVTDVSR